MEICQGQYSYPYSTYREVEAEKRNIFPNASQTSGRAGHKSQCSVGGILSYKYGMVQISSVQATQTENC